MRTAGREAAVLPDPIVPYQAEPAGAPAVRFRRGPLAPLIHRDFALFWSGAFVSNAGTWLQNVALSWLILSITDSPFWTSMVTFTQFFPMMIFGLPGGLMADRLERRRVLMVTQSVMMAVAFTLSIITFTGHASVATILPVLAVGGVALSFNAPSFQALVGDLVPRDVVIDAVSLNTAQFSAARVIGPVLGGMMLATVGAGWAFFANGVSFVAVLAALAMIRPRRQDPPASTGKRALLGGVRAMNEQPVIKTILILTAILSFFTAPALALMSVLARDVLAMGPGGYGALFATFSVGAVAGALTTGWLVRRLGMRRAIALGVGLIGVSLALIAASRSVVATSLLLAVIGYSYTAVVSTTSTGTQLSVSATKRGRVMSLYMMSWAGMFPIGSLLSGIVATYLGAPATLLGAGVPLLVCAAVLTVRGRSLQTVTV